MLGFFLQLTSDDKYWEKVPLTIHSLIDGDFGAAAVLISFGAILGKCNALQLLLLATIEIVFYSLNISVCANQLEAVDVGGSMYVHAFGAYFGVAASLAMSPKPAHTDPKNTSGYNSNLFAMIGTIFLWMYWPSFNGALVSGSQQHRVVINTVLSLTGSCLASFIVSFIEKKKLDMELVLNASLAGGVMIGSSADLVRNPAVSIVIGFAAGLISSYGFTRLSGFLSEKISLHDTCGVHNLHGIPGALGGLIGAIIASTATEG